MSNSMAKDDQLISRSEELRSLMETRRSVRAFRRDPVPKQAIINCISIAASAPSGANMQPWSFVLVSDPESKRAIRKKAEEIEEAFYTKRITSEWQKQLQPLGTGAQKPFLEEAPYLICIFCQPYGLDEQGNKITHYYPLESVGIATGFLISALHQLGIATLTYTPAPMHFLNDVLDRPRNEKPFMILAVGYPHEDYQPPKLEKKKQEEYLIER